MSFSETSVNSSDQYYNNLINTNSTTMPVSMPVDNTLNINSDVPSVISKQPYNIQYNPANDNTSMRSIKKAIRRGFNNKYLNPLKCSPEPLMKDPIIIYIIVMSIVLIFLYVFKYKVSTKFQLAIDWILIGIICSAALILLIKFTSQQPSKHTELYCYGTIIVAVIAAYIIMI